MDIISFEGSNATRGGDDRKPGTGSQIKCLVTRNQYNGPNTGELLSAEITAVINVDCGEEYNRIGK